MAKLHETLASLSDLTGAAKNILQETVTTFTKRVEHFSGYHRTYEPFNDDDKGAAAAEATGRELVTTVDAKLRYMFSHLVKQMDIEAQRDATNQVAKADVIIGDKVLIRDAPGTWLLGMEKRMKEWRQVLLSIPTLPPGEKWAPDTTRGKNVYTHAVKRTLRTKKAVQHKILVEATREHPAQIEKWTEDIPIGTWVQDEWAGMLTPAEKSDLLERFDILARAVVEARMRANNAEVVDVHYGQIIADYIIDGSIPTELRVVD